MRKVQCWYVKMAGVGNIDINIQSRKIRNASYCKEYINADSCFDLRYISYFITMLRIHYFLGSFIFRSNIKYRYDTNYYI